MVGYCRLGPKSLSKQTDLTPSDPLGRDCYVRLCSSATVGVLPVESVMGQTTVSADPNA